MRIRKLVAAALLGGLLFGVYGALGPVSGAAADMYESDLTFRTEHGHLALESAYRNTDIYDDEQLWPDIYEGDPSPDGQPTGLLPEDAESLFVGLELSGATLLETDPIETPAGQIVVAQGGSIIPHHNPADVFMEAEELGGSHGGGFDPNNGPIHEQINGMKGGGGGNDDDDDGDDAHKEDYGFYDGEYPANPELVNPQYHPSDRQDAATAR